MTTRSKGPSDGPPRIGGAEDTEAISETTEVVSTGATDEVQAPSSTAPSDSVSAVAAELRAGHITVEQAVEQLIDDAIGRQLGRLTRAEGETLGRELRKLLRDYASNDPYLAAKIRRLTISK